MEFRESQYRRMQEANVSIEHLTSLNLVQIGVNQDIITYLEN